MKKLVLHSKLSTIHEFIFFMIGTLIFLVMPVYGFKWCYLTFYCRKYHLNRRILLNYVSKTNFCLPAPIVDFLCKKYRINNYDIYVYDNGDINVYDEHNNRIIGTFHGDIIDTKLHNKLLSKFRSL